MRYVEDRQGYEAELFVDTDRVVRDTADEIYSDYSYKQLKDIQRSGKILALVKKYNSSLDRKEAEIAFEAALTWAKEDNVGARYESINESDQVTETIYAGDSGEKLMITADLSNVDDIVKFRRQLDHQIKNWDLKLYPQTDLTNLKKAFFVLPNLESQWKMLRSVFLMNDVKDYEQGRY